MADRKKQIAAVELIPKHSINEERLHEESCLIELNSSRVVKKSDDLSDLTNMQLCRNIVWMWLPLTFSTAIGEIINVANLAFVAHLNNTELLAAVALGNMMINIAAFAIMQGMNSALETLVAQAYGAGSYRRAGVLLHRGRFLYTLSFIITIIVLSQSEKLLVLLG